VISGQNLITYSRIGNGTYVDSDLILKTGGTDVPLFDHDPATGESLGLPLWAQRINSIRNNTMQGAVAGTPGTLPMFWSISGLAGLSREILQVGVSQGIVYLDIRLFGTTSGTFTNIRLELPGTAPASNGQTWTQTLYLAIVGGAAQNISSISSRVGLWSASNVFLADLVTTPANLIGIVGSELIRTPETSGTISNASVASLTGYLQLNYSSGVAIDVTLRIGLPQLEQGAGATSVIFTTNAAVTRNADFADLIDAAIANNIRTLYLEFRSPAVGTRGVVSLNDNTANERASVITSGTDPRLVVVDGGVEQANIDGGTITADTRTRVAVRIGANDFAISTNGGAVTTDTTGSLPTGDRLMLGRSQAGEWLNSRLARVTGWSQLLPNATMQALSGQ
jgi:hypothetical protein